MPVNTSQYSTMTSSAFDSADWSSGQPRGFRDVVTGDIVTVSWDSANSAVKCHASQDNGVTFYCVAKDFVVPVSGFPNRVQSICQSSDGKVHMLSWGTPSGFVAYYTRCTVERAGGRVIGLRVDQSALALPDHTIDGPDLRGTITIAKISGTEYPVWCYSGAFGAGATVDVYGGRISGTSGSTTSIGLDGTGSDTQLYTHAATGFLIGHTTQAYLVQEGTSEDLYLFFGCFNTDYYLGVASSTEYDIWGKRYTRSGGNWAAGSTTVIFTVPGGGGDEPLVMCAMGIVGKAILMYYRPGTGVAFAYFDSAGSLTTSWVTSPDSTSGRAYFGVFSTDGTNIWCAITNYNTNGTTRAGKLSYYNGSTWTHVTESSPPQAESFYAIQLSNGVVCIRGDGDTLGQTRSGNSFASVVDVNGFTPKLLTGAYGKVKAKAKAKAKAMGQCMLTDIKEWF